MPQVSGLAGRLGVRIVIARGSLLPVGERRPRRERIATIEVPG
jgi:hypothetical protein